MLKRGIAVFTLFAVIMILALPLGRPCEVEANEGLASEPLSIILLIDISGSMSRTDPQRLRETASGVFIDMLSPEDNLGIFIFPALFLVVLGPSLLSLFQMFSEGMF